MAGKADDYVFRHLPSSYRRAGTDGPAFALTRMLGRSLSELDRVSLEVMKSRFLEHANDLADAERLAALFELTPWPEEDLEAFRDRVRLMARVYLQGAATAESLLEVLGAAFDLELAGLTRPNAGDNDRYTTTGAFRERNADPVSFTAKVVDLPLTVRLENVTGPEFKWVVENNLYAEPPSIDAEGRYTDGAAPDPIVDIAAGEHPVMLPVLVQQDTRRLVLINRFIPAGSVLRVDLKRHKVYDVDGPSTLLGPVLFGAERPDLLYGTGGFTGGEIGTLSGPAAKPFHVLYWSDGFRRESGMPEVPGGPGTLDSVPAGKLPWPPMVALGTTRWRLLRGAGPDGEAPAIDASLPHASLRVLPLTADTMPDFVAFQWRGRRLGTFTIKYSERKLWDLPGASEQEKKRLQAWVNRRKAWLGQQIDRLKLAGVQYVDLCANPPVIPPRNTAYAPVLSLMEKLPLFDAVAADVTRAGRKLNLAETLIPADKAMASLSKATGATETILLTDAVEAVVTPAVEDHRLPEMKETLVPVDAVAALVVLGGEAHPSADIKETLVPSDALEALVAPGADGDGGNPAAEWAEKLWPKETLETIVIQPAEGRDRLRPIDLIEFVVLRDRLNVEVHSK